MLSINWDAGYNLFNLQPFFYVHNIIPIALDCLKK